MFVTATRLPHLATPDAYGSPEHFARERETLLKDSWHVVGTTDEFSRSGDFKAFELLGHAIQVRNFGGQLVALSNVCAHRHCLISKAGCGNSPTMKCQYHGWEFGADGRTRAIPSPKNFAPFPKQGEQIAKYRIDTCGQLVFVSVQHSARDGENNRDAGPSLRDWLGDFYELLEGRCSNGWSNNLVWEAEFPVNWKVVIENSLEAYHIPAVHPGTFQSDPGEDVSEHVLRPHRTYFETRLPFNPSRRDAIFQRVEEQFLRLIGRTPTGMYQQHHVFPNLLFSFTDTITLSHCVIPTGPKSCRCVARQFGVQADGWSRHLTRQWGRMTGWITKQVLLEDASMFPEIQRGLDLSPSPGILGRCEERIHAFQQYAQQRMHSDDALESAA